MQVSSEGSFYSQSLGKYCQLNQSNKHISTYSRIQQQTKKPYYATTHNEYAQDNPRINWQDRQKITFPGSANPKEISQQCTPATHTEAVHCQGVLLGVFHPRLWPLKARGFTFGGGSPNLLSARWRQYPQIIVLNVKTTAVEQMITELQTSKSGISGSARSPQSRRGTTPTGTSWVTTFECPVSDGCNTTQYAVTKNLLPSLTSVFQI